MRRAGDCSLGGPVPGGAAGGIATRRLTDVRRPAPASRSNDVLSLSSFVVLGLPDGMLGTASPAIRSTFGVPVGALGLILLIATAGSVLVTAFVGALIRRLGVPALLAVAGSGAALGYAGFALAPGLWLVLAAAVLVGAAAGMMDAGLNTAVALTGRPRLLNLLHGAYGVGTALGPLVVTGAILTGSWRPAYAALVGLDLVIAAAWLRQRRSLGTPRPRARPSSRGGLAPGRTVVPAPLPRGGGRGHGGLLRLYRPGSRGRAVGGELLPRAPEPVGGRDRPGHLRLLGGADRRPDRPGCAAAPGPAARRGALGQRYRRARRRRHLVAAGRDGDRYRLRRARRRPGWRLPGPDLAHPGPPRRAHHAQHVISWQVGSAAAGGAGLSAIIGLLIGATSLAVLGPAITVLAVIMVAAELVLARLAPVGRRYLAAPRRLTSILGRTAWVLRSGYAASGGTITVTARRPSCSTRAYPAERRIGDRDFAAVALVQSKRRNGYRLCHSGRIWG